MRSLQPSRPSMILTPSDTIQSIALTTAAQAFDVPAGAQYAVFSPGPAFYISFGSTAAAVPTTSMASPSTGNTCSELSPPSRDIHSTAKTTGFSVIATTAGALLTISWFGP